MIYQYSLLFGIFRTAFPQGWEWLLLNDSMHYAKLQNMGRRKSPERKRPQKIKTKENYFSSDFKIQLKSLKVFFQPTKNFFTSWSSPFSLQSIVCTRFYHLRFHDGVRFSHWYFRCMCNTRPLHKVTILASVMSSLKTCIRRHYAQDFYHEWGLT